MYLETSVKWRCICYICMYMIDMPMSCRQKRKGGSKCPTCKTKIKAKSIYKIKRGNLIIIFSIKGEQMGQHIYNKLLSSSLVFFISYIRNIDALKCLCMNLIHWNIFYVLTLHITSSFTIDSQQNKMVLNIILP